MKLSKNKLIFGIGMFLILVVLIATSYAYWQLTNTQTNENVVGSGCFDITFTENTSSINLSNTFPISDEEGLAGSPYSFTIKNICDYYVSYQVNLEVLPVDGGQTKLSDEYVKVGVNNKATILSSNDKTNPTINEAIESYKLATGVLATGAAVTYNMRLWLDAYAPQASSESRTFKSKITVTATVGKNYLGDAILAQGEGADSIEAKGNPNMALVPTSQTSGLYATEDEYGTSYYYRGEKNSLANNVIFAEHQWKILRINGDGSIRLIYNGICPDNICTIISEGPEAAINNGILYKWSVSNDDVKYMGYMYGGANEEASVSKIQAQSNDTDSDAKIIIDGWYEENLKGTEYEQYIVDNVFCNDRSISSGNGYGKMVTYYKVRTRLETNHLDPTPTLLCEQQNDRFTVNDTTIGNGALTYPIGLITADEVQYGGGGLDMYNTRLYLHIGRSFWTSSPRYFSGSIPYAWHVGNDGRLVSHELGNTYSFRVVINLTSKAVVASGNGTSNNPYIIKT